MGNKESFSLTLQYFYDLNSKYRVPIKAFSIDVTLSRELISGERQLSEKQLENWIGDERAKRFRHHKKTKIRKSKIPEGMKLVKTPFGDRLVPED